MWWRWLINRPVIKWRINDWVSGLSETDSDWGWLIGDEVLKVSSGNVGIHELEETISVGFLSKTDCDW